VSCRNGLWGDEPDGENDLICVRVADFDRTRRRVILDTPTLRAVSPSKAGSRLLRKGDLLIEKSGGGEQQPVGTVVLFEHAERAICSNFVARMEPDARQSPEYLCYLHRALYGLRVPHRSIKQTTGIQNLDADSYFDEKVALPPRHVQDLIVAFLDRKTAKLDALVAKNERLIELLEEKRTTTLERALRGADGPTVKLGYLATVLAGYAFPSDGYLHGDAGIRLLRGINISTDGLRWNETVRWDDTDLGRLKRYALRDGDLVFGMDRPWVSSGVRIAAVSNEDLPSLLLQRVLRLRATPRIRQEYLRLILASRAFREYFEPELTGVSVPHISDEQVRSYRTQLPSLEQQDDVCRLARRLAQTVAPIRTKLNVQQQQLREYRQALITAAVTGQLDVQEASE
jgi:type I restriction enzyme S subunit